MRLRAISQLTAALGDLLYPHNCIGCGRGVEDDTLRYVCTACADRLYWINPPACTTCSSPFYGRVDSPQNCPNCLELKPVFRSGRALFLLRGIGGQLIHELKYRRGLYLLKAIESLMQQRPELPAFLQDTILVPVPLHPRRKNKRGFNQSHLIAASLAKVGGGLPIQHLLRRTIHTPSQTRLNRKERQRNLRNAFALACKTSIDPQKKYILVDDVFTTGSTLNACCKILRKAGLKDLHVFTLGHG